MRTVFKALSRGDNLPYDRVRPLTHRSIVVLSIQPGYEVSSEQDVRSRVTVGVVGSLPCVHHLRSRTCSAWATSWPC
jgi:hypothetical protein